MIEDAKKLEQMGATFIVIPCNTAHFFYQYIQDEVKIPVVNIIEETISYIARQSPETKNRSFSNYWYNFNWFI